MIRNFSLTLLMLGLLGTTTLRSAESNFIEDDIAEIPVSGALITQIVPDGEGVKAGLKPGDIVTKYGGAKIGGAEALPQEIGKHAKETGPIVLELVRDGKSQRLNVKPGRLGIMVTPVEKGKPFVLLPPETVIVYDLSELEKEPQDLWYEFYIGGKKVGFEHNKFSYDKATTILAYESEVAFDFAEAGIQHFVVSCKAKAVREEFPKFQSAVFITLQANGEDYVVRTAPQADGQLKLDHTYLEDGKKKSESEVIKNPEDTMHDYMAHIIGSLLPRNKNACLHYTQLTSQGLQGKAAIRYGGLEEVDVRGQTQQLHRFDKFVGASTSTSRWIDEKGRIVKSFYGGNETFSYLSTKEKALEGLSQKIKPMTAK